MCREAISSRKIKVLFLHNSVPEYRLVFWKELAIFVDLQIFITRNGLDERIYGLEKDIGDLRIEYLESQKLSFLKSLIEGVDVIILPPCDAPKEWMVSRKIKRICKKLRKPYIFWTEAWELKGLKLSLKKRIKNLIHCLMIRSVAKSATKCIASGTKVKEYFCDKVKIANDKVVVAYDSSTSPLPLEPVNIRANLNISKKDKIVLFLGRLVERKGCDILIKAFSMLRDDSVHLIIGGDGEQSDALKKLVANEHIRNVHFIGKIQPSQRRSYFEQSNVFVLPSYSLNGVIEAWGLTLNEALECGTPVVATNIVGAAYDLIGKDTGIMVKENDVKGLLEAIKTIVYNTDEYSREDIKSSYAKFSVHGMAMSFYGVIESV